MARRNSAGHGTAGLGAARQGPDDGTESSAEDSLSSSMDGHSWARLGRAQQGMARLGLARAAGAFKLLPLKKGGVIAP